MLCMLRIYYDRSNSYDTLLENSFKLNIFMQLAGGCWSAAVFIILVNSESIFLGKKHIRAVCRDSCGWIRELWSPK